MKKDFIKFGNWLSANYIIDDGVGSWSGYENHTITFTTEQLYDKWIKLGKPNL